MNHWESLINPSALIPPPLRIPAQVVPIEVTPPKKQRRGQRTRGEWLRERFDKSFEGRLMLMLKDGAMDCRDFRQMAGQVSSAFDLQGKEAIAHAINHLVAKGLIVREAKLTAKGLEKLGLKGPR